MPVKPVTDTDSSWNGWVAVIAYTSTSNGGFVPVHLTGSIIGVAVANVFPASNPVLQSFWLGSSGGGGGAGIVTLSGADTTERPSSSTAVTVTANVPAVFHAWVIVGTTMTPATTQGGVFAQPKL